ncbi:MAG: hypothetical protein ACOCU8_01140 [Patescibacteria group bacterium]
MFLSKEALKQRNLAQIQEALSPENRWFAGQFLGHKPTDSEAVSYYISHGGAEGFARRMAEE